MCLENHIKVKETYIYGCSECNITSETKGRKCPCPKGGCDAEIIGKKIVTKEIKIFTNGSSK